MSLFPHLINYLKNRVNNEILQYYFLSLYHFLNITKKMFQIT